jgi:hypothetical protein
MGPGSALALLACPGRRRWSRARCHSQFNFHTPHSHLSSPGLTGRSSIPETAVLEPRRRGVLDAPHSRGMTVENDARSHSRGTIARALQEHPPSLETEGAGNAGCTLHPRSRVQDAQRNAHTSIQVQRRQSGIPCAMALRLMPCSPRRRILFCHRRQRIKTLSKPGWADASPRT